MDKSIENGMIVGAERHDPQCQDVECSRCDTCDQWVPDTEIAVFGNGDRVCNDCLHDYLESQGADFVPGYIAQNEAEFWLDWLFANADPDEQLRVVKAKITNLKELLLKKLHGDFLRTRKSTGIAM